MAAKCEHKSKKLLEKKVTNVEEVPAPMPQPLRIPPIKCLMNARTVEKSGRRPKKSQN